MSGKRGRPALGADKRQKRAIRLSDADWARVVEAAAEAGLTASTFAQRAILAALD